MAIPEYSAKKILLELLFSVTVFKLEKASNLRMKDVSWDSGLEPVNRQTDGYKPDTQNVPTYFLPMVIPFRSNENPSGDTVLKLL